MTKRIWYYDYLRVLACFGVMLLHTSALCWTEEDMAQWQVLNIYNGLGRFAVTVFVLISGALFIGRDIPLKKLLSKYILRLLTAYLVWSLIYALYDGGGVKTVIINFIGGKYHMWYLPMTMGLYLLLPLINRLAGDRKLLIYFVILFFIFASLIPVLVQLTRDYGGPLGAVAVACNQFVGFMEMKAVMGFTGAFILGYLLSTAQFSAWGRRCMIALLPVGALLTIGLNSLSGYLAGAPVETYFGNLRPYILAFGAGLFVLFRYHVDRPGKLYPLVAKLSRYSLGAYLIHVLILNLLQRAGLSPLGFTPVLSVPVIALITFVASMAASACLNQIPVIINTAFNTILECIPYHSGRGRILTPAFFSAAEYTRKCAFRIDEKRLPK